MTSLFQQYKYVFCFFTSVQRFCPRFETVIDIIAQTNGRSKVFFYRTEQMRREKNTRCGGRNPHNKLLIFVIFYASKYFTNVNAAIFDAIVVTVSLPRFLLLRS